MSHLCPRKNVQNTQKPQVPAAFVVDCLSHSQHSCRPPKSARWAASTTPDDVNSSPAGAPRGVAGWNENRRSVDLHCDPGAPRPGRTRRSCDHNATPLDPSNNRTDDDPDRHPLRPRARCRRQRRRPRARHIRYSGDSSGAQPLRLRCPSARQPVSASGLATR